MFPIVTCSRLSSLTVLVYCCTLFISWLSSESRREIGLDGDTPSNVYDLKSCQRRKQLISLRDHKSFQMRYHHDGSCVLARPNPKLIHSRTLADTLSLRFRLSPTTLWSSLVVCVLNTEQNSHLFHDSPQPCHSFYALFTFLTRFRSLISAQCVHSCVSYINQN